ncbi:MAG: ribonuclease P protein component [Candidatus Omnitrophica bacterium]|nr:ribonuclease P protein component [Candidatus Omnitrophota bacterium]
MSIESSGQKLRLSKECRLRKNRQFVEVYLRGRRISGPHFTIFYKPNSLTLCRMGLSVRKKRFKLSARRHYIQRRLREVFRLNKERFLPGYDLVFSAHRFEKGKVDFRQITTEMLSLAQKAGVAKC